MVNSSGESVVSAAVYTVWGVIDESGDSESIVKS